MLRKTKLFCLLVVFVTNYCYADEESYKTVESVSIIQLISNPDIYDGKYVKVAGVIRIEFEGNALFFTKEHYKYRISKNSLWISPDYKALNQSPQELVKLNGSYVILTGIFDKNDSGHMGMNSGSIKEIDWIKPWESVVESIEKIDSK